MTKIKFEKIGDHFKVDRNNELEDLINNTIKNISFGNENLYFETNTLFLIENIVARIICSKFIEYKLTLPETGFTLVEVNYNGNIINVSIGILDINGEKKYVCGILI